MKRLICLCILLLSMLTGCIPVPVIKDTDTGSPQIVNQEQIIFSGYGLEELREAAEKFLKVEQSFFAAKYGKRPEARYVKCYVEVLHLLLFEKGEAQMIMTIGQDRWCLYMEKSLFQDWYVTDYCLLHSGSCHPAGYMPV